MAKFERHKNAAESLPPCKPQKFPLDIYMVVARLEIKDKHIILSLKQ